MKLILFLLHLFTGLPDLGVGTQPSGIQLNGNVKSVTGDRPGVGAADRRGSGGG